MADAMAGQQRRLEALPIDAQLRQLRLLATLCIAIPAISA
jgi:hypothetical protein